MRFSLPVAYLLWFVGGFGTLGFHRFYMRKIGTGVLWFLSGGGLVVGTVYDFFTMPRQIAEANMREEYRDALGMQSRGYLPGRVEFPNRPDSIEKVILRTARKNGGAVTPGEVALEGDFEMDAAKKALDKLAAAGHAEMRIRSSGVVVYVFPEFSRDGSTDYVD